MATTKRGRWTPEARKKQASLMRVNMKRKWEKVRSNPALIADESRRRSLYVMQGHPLSVWMTDNRVGLTHSDLANKVGVSPMTVSNWVAGRSTPRAASVQKLEELAKQYPVSLDLGWTSI